jgi:hypothetical protein
MSGQIVDATLVAAPKQRNNEDEKKAIKEGRIPEVWAEKPASMFASIMLESATGHRVNPSRLDGRLSLV